MSIIDERFQNNSTAARTVSFGNAFAQSPQFDDVFSEGMALVERAASYLDGEGRRDSRALVAPVSTAYATESMRLTTRLLDVASWLLVQRALKNGEITADEAERRRRKVKLRPSGPPAHIKHFDQLPEALQAMITDSFAMSDRIMRIDRAMRSGEEETPAVTTNPVGAQISTIRAAFTVIQGGRG
jgi:regulator of CtrA degradation